MSSETRPARLGILVGGGPAPGINAVIHSATIEAENHGLEVVGIYEGFRYLAEGRMLSTPLTISRVSRIHLDGGSILRTARTNPASSDDALRRAVTALSDAGITLLVGIGGDDTVYSLYRVTQFAAEEMGVSIRSVHVPKTIDNDLPLPEGIPTFGFETAREVGTRLVRTYMEDALTSGTWFIVVTMGRKAGHLALGIGKSSGATLTVIPEEWRGRPVLIREVVDILVTAMIKRVAEGKRHGVALVAEGILEYLSEEDKKMLADIAPDDHGHTPLHDFNLSDYLKHEVEHELRKLEVKAQLRDKDLGYELRCAPPIAYDIDYTRSLGEAAVDFLLAGGSGATITIQGNQVVPIPFERMMDPSTGRTEVRIVNVDSFTYRSAAKFMIRLKPEHAHDEAFLPLLAKQTCLSPEAFKARYGYLIGVADRPY